jgi:predicted nucleic acid-binding protein
VGEVTVAERLWLISRTFLAPISHDVLLLRMWELRNNLTADDAVYVASAEALDAPPLTADRRLVAAAGHDARIRLA